MLEVDYKKRILRIWSQRDGFDFHFCGMGLYLEDGYMITCAHILKNKGENNYVDFPLFFDSKEKIKVSTILELSDKYEDIAILRLVDATTNKVPNNPKDVLLKTSLDYWGHNFRVFGGTQKNPSGDWVHGNLRGLNANGWLQAESKVSSISVDKGFSGSPVWDDNVNGIIGLVAEKYDNNNLSFIIPNQRIEELLIKNGLSNIFKSVHYTKSKISFNFHRTPIKRLQKEHEIISDLRKMVQNEVNEKILILKGAGGYGKTTIANSIKDEQQIISLFKDGIFWINFQTSKQKSKDYFLGKIEELIRTISGDLNFKVSTIEGGATYLSSLLLNTKALLIYDNLTNFTFAPFLLPKSVDSIFFITCRKLPPFRANAITHEIGKTKWKESFEILGNGLKGIEVGHLKILADRLGHMPQLLALANRYLDDRINFFGQNADTTIKYVNDALVKKGIVYFDNQDSASKSRAISATIGFSLDLLEETEVNKLKLLSIFPLGSNIPFEVIKLLWEDDIYDVEFLCEKFYKISLIEKIDFENRSINIHDIIHQYLLRLLDVKKEVAIRHFLSQVEFGSLIKEASNEGNDYMLGHYGYFLIDSNNIEKLLSIYKDRNNLSKWIWNIGMNLFLQDLSYVSGNVKNIDIIKSMHHLFTKHGYLIGKCINEKEVLHIINYLFLSNPVLKNTTENLKDSDSISFYPIIPVPSTYSYPEIYNLTGHTDEIVCCSLSVGEQYLVTASNEGVIKVWEVNIGYNLYSINAHKDRITACLTTNNDEFLTSSEDGTIKLWDLESGTLIKELAHDSSVNSIDLNLKNDSLVSAHDNQIIIWNLEDGKVQCVSESIHEDEITCCSFSGDNKSIISASASGQIILWVNQAENIIYQKSLIGHSERVTACYFLDSEKIISSSFDSTIRIWDIKSNSDEVVLNTRFPVNTLIITSDKRYVLAGNHNGEIEIWDLISQKRKVNFKAHVQMVNWLLLGRDNKSLYSISEDRKIKIWDISNFDLLNEISHNRQNIQSVVKSWDESYIAITESNRDEIKIYTGDKFQYEFYLKGHSGTVLCCDFSPQNEQLNYYRLEAGRFG